MQPPGILFTAFEPSGDEHAAPVIAELRRRLPDVPIYALGGPQMAAAGARLIETTTDRSAMLGGAVSQARVHHQRLKRLKPWLTDHPLAVHVPTDSPAANWSICKMIKEKGSGERHGKRVETRVVHLVAPQVWAWASWRVRRLRKWSDLVLCVLPFEPDWFEHRGVEARFIGHPLFDEPLKTAELDKQAEQFPLGSPRIALLPGSRPGEVRANWPVMAAVFKRLALRFDGAQAVVAVADASAADRVKAMTVQMPANLRIVTGQTEAALHWADVVLTASGTATLHVARHGKPMAILYRVSPLTWHAIGRWIIDTRTFTLPNLIAAGGPHREPERHIVREFVPWLGGVGGDVEPIVGELASLVKDADKRDRQIEALGRVVSQFEGRNAGQAAAEAIISMAEWGVASEE